MITVLFEVLSLNLHGFLHVLCRSLMEVSLSVVFLTAHWLNLALRGKGKMWASSFLQPNTLRGRCCQRWKNTDLWITKRDPSCYNTIQTVLSSGTETCSKMANARWRQSFYKVSCWICCNFHTVTILIYSSIVYCYIRRWSKKKTKNNTRISCKIS